MFFQKDVYTENGDYREPDGNYIFALGYAMIFNELGQ